MGQSKDDVFQRMLEAKVAGSSGWRKNLRTGSLRSFFGAPMNVMHSLSVVATATAAAAHIILLVRNHNLTWTVKWTFEG